MQGKYGLTSNTNWIFLIPPPKIFDGWRKHRGTGISPGQPESTFLKPGREKYIVYYDERTILTQPQPQKIFPFFEE